MPLVHTNSGTSNRRSLSSKSLATNPSKFTLSARVPSQPKLSALGKKRTTEVEFSCVSGDHSVILNGEKRSDLELDMTFLQYCPTCDKQILVPNNLVLYCSESCRRKDSLSTTPPPELKFVSRSSSFLNLPASPTSNMAFRMHPFDDDDSSSDEQSQTSLYMTSASLPVRASKPPELHSFKQDLDPTEWKPNATSATVSSNPVSAVSPSFVVHGISPTELPDSQQEGSANSETTGPNKTAPPPTTTMAAPENPRRQSAAFGYLAQFHRSSSSFRSLASRRPSLKTRGSSTSTSTAAVTSTTTTGNCNVTGRTSRPETPAMSLGHSSTSSAASSSSSIALCTPGHQDAFSSITSHDGTEDTDNDHDRENEDGGLTFGKKALGHVGAGAKAVPGMAEGSLRELLAKAA